MIDVSFDVARRALGVATTPRTHGSKVRIIMTGNSGRHELSGLRCGVSILLDGAMTANVDLPGEGQKIVASDQAMLAAVQVSWVPDCLVEVQAWVEEGGERFDATATFVSPRPQQPYPSWGWSADLRSWQPPSQMPDDGLLYEWDEVAAGWIAA